MRVRKLSPSGDYTFGNSSIDFLENSPEAVGQIVKTGLLLWRGEWFLDTTVGMPWMDGVLGKHSQDMADSTIRNQILNTQNVTGIASFSSSVDSTNRKYSFQCTINTAFGPTDVEISNFVNF